MCNISLSAFLKADIDALPRCLVKSSNHLLCIATESIKDVFLCFSVYWDVKRTPTTPNCCLNRWPSICLVISTNAFLFEYKSKTVKFQCPLFYASVRVYLVDTLSSKIYYQYAYKTIANQQTLPLTGHIYKIKSCKRSSWYVITSQTIFSPQWSTNEYSTKISAYPKSPTEKVLQYHHIMYH